MSQASNAALSAYYQRDPEALVRLINSLEINMEKHAVLSIARVVHEVNRQYCASHGDHSQLPWDDAPNWQRESAVKGVEMHLANPNATPEDSHISWMKEKEEKGWKYGEFKDDLAKTHPCMVPYVQLDERQRAKDWIFRGVVHAIAAELVRPSLVKS